MAPSEARRIVDAYYRELTEGGDFAAIPLAADVSFRGPLVQLDGAGALREMLAGIAQDVRRLDVVRQFDDGEFVQTIYDFDAGAPAPIRCSETIRVVDSAIASIELFFDPPSAYRSSAGGYRMTFVDPQYLVETDWLAANLDDPTLRILDATVFLRPPSPDAPRSSYIRESGRAAWDEGHIPGSAFVDLIEDLSDPEASLPFMMPSGDRFAAALSRAGVGPGTRVVCYDGAMNMWAARLWWMLRAFGFEDAAVLSGGWRKWTLEGRPVSTEPPSYPPAAFVARPRPELIASSAEVQAAIGDGASCIVNALSAEMHAGTGQAPYGRAGRISGSVNVPAAAIVDPETNAFLPPHELRAHFERAGALGGGRVITYCGGGIAAASDALALTLLGVEDVALYDASLSEWAKDPSLPMETD